MGTLSFAKILKYGCLAAFGLAAATAALAALSTPASAQSPSEENGDTSKTVDVRSHQACWSAIADAFFQTGGDNGAVNDFPAADFDEGSETWHIAETGSRSDGCAE